jgi:hypothetical protein
MRVFHELGVSSPYLYIFRCQLEKLKLLENSKLGITSVLRHLGLYSQITSSTNYERDVHS